MSRSPFRVLVLGICLWLRGFTPIAGEEIEGNAAIRGRSLDSDIVIRTTNRTSGAIDSLVWRGREFLDSYDHGRQMQSASNFDAGGAFVSETFNPTEAGSRRDGTGPASTSRLLELEADGNRLRTKCRMAFWLRPGERSAGHLARNPGPLSNHLLEKEVVIGFRDLPNVIQYRATFTVPEGERHAYAQFEAVTGYMPPEFSAFFGFDPSAGTLNPLDDGPGEQSLPVVLSTEDGTAAMGIFSPDQPSRGFEQAGYGRFRFLNEKVVKWNCVFRHRDREHGIRPGEYLFRNYVVLGTRDEVAATLKTLHALFQ